MGDADCIGYFASDEEAAKAYDAQLRKHALCRRDVLLNVNFRHEDDYYDENDWEDVPIPPGLSSRFIGVTKLKRQRVRSGSGVAGPSYGWKANQGPRGEWLARVGHYRKNFE